MWDLIVSVPDHCLSFYSVMRNIYALDKQIQQKLHQNAYVCLIFGIPVHFDDAPI